ncbi:glycoside hydrolase family 20 zincin-like fold domain-containing protein [Chitinophaga sp. Ak27]|uniref:glycoside hydrolase family 20 zincin-like fold domain-containing protein n=1 Tax=Chitinophaga sp. Ak27 TaxID=2726116 RepID=UPI00145CE8A4|nr:glycoside hydrolase family 20 zincin-like fold domain-containing protein [Chitinophaga sp. Ak27]NLU90493.1 hypothetical protein [Chitinophaga sp. Ak27]
MRYWMIALVGCLFQHLQAQQPALIPQPLQLHWTSNKLPLYKIKYIYLTDSSLLPIARILQQQLSEREVSVDICWNRPAAIELELSPVKVPEKEEGYRLAVNAERCTVSAGTAHVAYEPRLPSHGYLCGTHLVWWQPDGLDCFAGAWHDGGFR